MIETLEDVIEQLADALGVYGAHGDLCPRHPDWAGRGAVCRVCWTSKLRARIEAAVEIERKLSS